MLPARSRVTVSDVSDRPRDRATDRVLAIDPGVKFNKGRRGSVSAESMRPSNEETARIVVPKRYAAAMLTETTCTCG